MRPASRDNLCKEVVRQRYIDLSLKGKYEIEQIRSPKYPWTEWSRKHFNWGNDWSSVESTICRRLSSICCRSFFPKRWKDSMKNDKSTKTVLVALIATSWLISGVLSFQSHIGHVLNRLSSLQRLQSTFQTERGDVDFVRELGGYERLLSRKTPGTNKVTYLIWMHCTPSLRGTEAVRCSRLLHNREIACTWPDVTTGFSLSRNSVHLRWPRCSGYSSRCCSNLHG
jgi:hypothetical protein